MVPFVVFLLVVGTSIWVGADAANLMRGLTKEQKKQIGGARSPAEWVFGCLFLWLIAFPWYLSKRSRYSEAQRPLQQVQPSESRSNTCAVCERPYTGSAHFCPNCGSDLRQPEIQVSDVR